MQMLRLQNSDELSMIGLGTFKSEPGVMHATVTEALKLGYRHIDCAPVYGNQPEVGEAFNSFLKQNVMSRSQVWITSKLWNDSHDPDDVRPALEKTLTDLNLDFLDLYLMHWPVAVKKGLFLPRTADDLISLKSLPLEKTWHAMEKLVDQGLCRHIGVSNFSVNKLKSLCAIAEIKPEVNQIELHPYLQQPEMFKFCNNEKITITAYSPLGSPDRPERLREESEPVLLQEPAILSLAEKHAVTPAQILLSWLVSKGVIAIPKSTNPARMKQNLAATEVKLSNDDMGIIEQLDRNYRYYKGGAWILDGSDYTLENLWDEKY